MSEAPTSRGLRVARKRRFVAEPGIWEPRGCLPVPQAGLRLPIDMGHAALLVHFPSSDRTDSERAQRVQLLMTNLSRFPATLRNKQLELPPYKALCGFFAGVVLQNFTGLRALDALACCWLLQR